MSSSKRRKSSSDDDDDVVVLKKKKLSPTKVCIASYNIWFGMTNDGSPHPQERMQAIVENLLSGKDEASPLPLLVGFQEVTPALQRYLKPSLESLGYRWISQDLSEASYGCAIVYQEGACELVEHGWMDYQHTIMGRGFLWAHVRIQPQGSTILFGTTHLESFLKAQGYNGSTQRVQQVQEWQRFCESSPVTDVAIVTGDMNWDDERKRSGGMDPPMMGVLTNQDWVDAWRHLHPKDEGYTYDSKLSPMLRGNLRRRFDRVLLLPGKSNVEVDQVDLFGTDAIPDLTFQKPPNPYTQKPGPVVPVTPSDHFGLRVTISLS